MKKILVTTTALLDDRKILFSSFLDQLKNTDLEVHVASTCYSEETYQKLYNERGVKLLAFPEVKQPREWVNILRRINDAAWDYKNNIAARISLFKYNFSEKRKKTYRKFRNIGTVIDRLGLHGLFEKSLFNYMIRKSSMKADFLAEDYDMLVVTGPNRIDEPLLASYFKSKHKKVAAYIHSMDNLSTKNRMFPHFDAFFVWSEEMKKQLISYYPYAKEKPIYIVGACQYDVLFQEKYQVSKDTFLEKIGFTPEIPTILYALGSPNFIKEQLAIAPFLKKLDQVGNPYQVILRPHPQFSDKDLLLEELKLENVKVYTQSHYSINASFKQKFQDESDIVNWVNTITHTDVCINLSSSIAVDACIVDTPVININFDPSDDPKIHQMIKDINSTWEHFSPLVKLNAFDMADSVDDILEGVLAYQTNKKEKEQARQKAAKLVISYLDANSGQRWLEAIEQLSNEI